MHTDSGMTGISLSGYMPYMTVASLEMSDEPDKRQVFRWYKYLGNATFVSDARFGLHVFPPKSKSRFKLIQDSQVFTCS